MASGAAPMAACKSAMPQGVSIGLTRRTASRVPKPPSRITADGVPSGDLFIGRRNQVLEIDDDRIRGERFRLFERVLVVAGNVENAAPGSHRHRQVLRFVNADGALHNSPLQRAAQLNFGTTNKNPAICCELNNGHTCYGPAGRSKPPRCKPQGPCARSSSFHHTSPTERSVSRLWSRRCSKRASRSRRCRPSCCRTIRGSRASPARLLSRRCSKT